MSDLEQMKRLAELVKQKNHADGRVAEFIVRPALPGHFGDFVGAEILGIELHASAVERGSDGRFAEGRLFGMTVNIKYYPKNEGLLDISIDGAPDYYLVLTGPRSAAVSSRGKTRPWVIEAVYLFETASLIGRLTTKIGIATSVRREFWDAAEIYPRDNPAFSLTPLQRETLALFSEASVG